MLLSKISSSKLDYDGLNADGVNRLGFLGLYRDQAKSGRQSIKPRLLTD
jgi:hypothetical protein